MYTKQDTDEILADAVFWLWARVLFVGLCLLVGVAIMSACGCTPAQYPGAQVSRASVVTLVTPRERSDADGVWSRVVFVPSCNAFAVERDSEVYLATAAHCLADPPTLGQTLRYLAPNGVGHGFARVTFLDLSGDRALAVATGGDLEPLREAGPPGEGAWVESVSSYYSAVSAGTVIGELSDGWHQTTQTIVFGWSGSPVLDRQGRAWGIVSKCPLASTVELAAEHGVGLGTCLPGATIVTVLP